MVDFVQHAATNEFRSVSNRLLAAIVGGSWVRRSYEKQHYALRPNKRHRLHQSRAKAPIVGLEPTTLGLTVPRSTS